MNNLRLLALVILLAPALSRAEIKTITVTPKSAKITITIPAGKTLRFITSSLGTYTVNTVLYGAKFQFTPTSQPTIEILGISVSQTIQSQGTFILGGPATLVVVPPVSPPSVVGDYLSNGFFTYEL